LLVHLHFHVCAHGEAARTKKPNENKGSKLLSDKMVEGRRSLFGAQISTPERCIPILVLSP
uniref:Uncharacterized protein n=1 Tax=Aegilops tauschii subsp. strangulata TaxID=200361 RepID=A0A452Y0L8_AEGTS